MKFIKSKLLQKAEGRKQGKYQLTLEVTDNDLLMIEDLALTMEPFQLWEDCKGKKITWEEYEKLEPHCYFTDKYCKWLNKTWKCFWQLWREYD